MQSNSVGNHTYSGLSKTSTFNATEPVSLDSEVLPWGNKPSCIAGPNPAKEHMFLPSREHSTRYSVSSGESSQVNNLQEIAEASSLPCRRPFDFPASDSFPLSSPEQLTYNGLHHGAHFDDPSSAQEFRNDTVDGIHVSDNSAYPPPTYQPQKASRAEHQPASMSRNHSPSSGQHDRPLRSASHPAAVDMEGGDIRAETHVMSILSRLLALHAFPAATLGSHGASSLSYAARVRDSPGLDSHPTFQQFDRLGVRKRHESYLASDIDLMDPDDPRETGGNLNTRDMKFSFLGKKGKNSMTVVAVLKRQNYILKLAKALVYFGAPSHRIESQLIAASKVLNIESHFVQLPNVVICTFGDIDTKTSQTHFIKANGHVTLGKLHSVHNIYRMVCHDEISAETGTVELCKLLKSPPIYGFKTRVALAFGSAALVCPMAFGGTLVEMGFAGLCGGTLAFLQLHAAKRSSVYADVFEISIAMILSFIARLLSGIPGEKFCYESISAAGIVLILPGDLILTSSLELASKNMVCGSVRMVYAIIYSLFLGFGLTVGSDIGFLVNLHLRREVDLATRQLINSVVISGDFTSENATSHVIGGTFEFANVTQSVASNIIKGCYRDPEWSWYFRPFPAWTLFILVPLYTFLSTSWNLQPWKSKQLPAMIIISCCSYAANIFSNHYVFGRSDIVSAIGAFVVGILGNMYSRIWGGTAFTAMLPGVLTLIPDGIAAAGGFTQNYRGKDADQYSTSIMIGLRMIQVAIGITVGLFGSGLLVYSFGQRKKNALFAF